MIEEREMMLPCRVSGEPSPVVRWTKDNVSISADDVHYRILSSHWLVIPVVRYRTTLRTDLFNGHFPREPGLAGYPNDNKGVMK